MNPFRVALAVARKDIRSEWRTREMVPALAQFIVLALLIGNFGFQIDARNAPAIAPGILWLALVFAGLVAFGRTFAAEREQASLEAMLPRTVISRVTHISGATLASPNGTPTMTMAPPGPTRSAAVCSTSGWPEHSKTRGAGGIAARTSPAAATVMPAPSVDGQVCVTCRPPSHHSCAWTPWPAAP